MMMNRRLYYLSGILGSIVFGLLSRKLGGILPAFLEDHSGDALWAMMVYFGIRFFLPNRTLFLSILLSLCFCFAIEFSQLYQADWIKTIRRTTLGALVLGKGFIWIDLVRYTVGILIASIIDTVIILIRKEEKHEIKKSTPL